MSCPRKLASWSISVSVKFSTVERVAACFRNLVDVSDLGRFASHTFAKPRMLESDPRKCVMASGLANIYKCSFKTPQDSLCLTRSSTVHSIFGVRRIGTGPPRFPLMTILEKCLQSFFFFQFRECPVHIFMRIRSVS